MREPEKEKQAEKDVQKAFMIGCVRGSRFPLGSANGRLAGPCPHNGKTLIYIHFEW